MDQENIVLVCVRRVIACFVVIAVGMSDLVWRNRDGSITVWTMRGLNRIAKVRLAGPGALRVIP